MGEAVLWQWVSLKNRNEKKSLRMTAARLKFWLLAGVLRQVVNEGRLPAYTVHDSSQLYRTVSTCYLSTVQYGS